jgi:hypothetical protein
VSQSGYAVAENRFFASSRIVHDTANRHDFPNKNGAASLQRRQFLREGGVVTVPRRPTMS